MASYAVRLDHASVCEGELGRFRFTRPKGYDFNAGQFMSLTLDTRAGRVAHLLSIASIPSEGRLEICTRLTGSPFKDALLALEPGDEVTVSAARGDLAVPANARGAVFLAGGVGVAPVRSLVASAVQRRFAGSLTLFQADRSARCMPYADEFRALDRAGALTWVPVLSRTEPGWRGESGHISAEMIRRHMPTGLKQASWVLAGPPGMVTAMQAVVAELGVPTTDIVVERLSGYE